MARTDAELVLAVRSGDSGAFAGLFEGWFDRVYGVARNIVRDDDQAAEVAQDTFLTVWQQLDRLDDPDKFGGWALRIGRNKALNRLQKEQRSRPMDADVMTGLHDRGATDLTGSERMIETSAISEVRDRQELVWAATAVLGERDASLADLLLRHQLSPAEIAEELGVEPNNAHQLLYRLRSKLGDAVANYLLWRNGRPRCEALSGLVAQDAGFDRQANATVQRHARTCAVCADQRQSVVDPQKLFASVPLLIAPIALKANAAGALEAMGVPASGSGSGPDAGDGGSGHDAPPDDDGDESGGRRWPGRLARGAVALAAIAFVLLMLSDETGEPDLVVTLADTTTTTSTSSSTSMSTSTTSSTSSTTSTTIVDPTSTVPIPVAPPTPDAPARPTRPGPAPPTPDPGTTPPTPAPAPPEIIRFSVASPVGISVFCLSGLVPARAVWATSQVDTVVLTTTTDTFTGPASGDQIFCARTGSVVTLEATGSGGTVSATDNAPGGSP